MKIALVVGHDAHSKGAYGSEGISEFDFNHSLLLDLNVNNQPGNNQYYIFYRSADIKGYTAKMIDLHERIDKVGCDVSIEFHFNSFSDEDVHGHEVLYCSDGGKQMAEIVNHQLDLELPTSNRGIKKVKLNPHPIPDDRGAGFCCRGRSLAIIIEPFFGSNQEHFIHDGKLRKPYFTALKRAFTMMS